jgi:hypothetical protein
MPTASSSPLMPSPSHSDRKRSISAAAKAMLISVAHGEKKPAGRVSSPVNPIMMLVAEP